MLSPAEREEHRGKDGSCDVKSDVPDKHCDEYLLHDGSGLSNAGRIFARDHPLCKDGSGNSEVDKYERDHPDVSHGLPFSMKVFIRIFLVVSCPRRSCCFR